MPALTPSDLQDQILREVGDVQPGTGDPVTNPAQGIVYASLDYLWARHAGQDQVSPGLRELYVKRDALEMILAVLIQRRLDVNDQRAGLRIRADQIVTNYEHKLDRVLAQISGTEKAVVSGSNAYRSARIRTRSPIAAPYPPDPSSTRYGGSVRGAVPSPWVRRR